MKPTRKARKPRKESFKSILTRNGFRSYDEYLGSEAWARSKERFFKSAYFFGSCECCGSSNFSLDVHHKTYANVCNESPKDLVALCRTCHIATHMLRGLVGGSPRAGRHKIIRKHIQYGRKIPKQVEDFIRSEFFHRNQIQNQSIGK